MASRRCVLPRLCSRARPLHARPAHFPAPARVTPRAPPCATPRAPLRSTLARAIPHGYVIVHWRVQAPPRGGRVPGEAPLAPAFTSERPRAAPCTAPPGAAPLCARAPPTSASPHPSPNVRPSLRRCAYPPSSARRPRGLLVRAGRAGALSVQLQHEGGSSLRRRLGS